MSTWMELTKGGSVDGVDGDGTGEALLEVCETRTGGGMYEPEDCVITEAGRGRPEAEEAEDVAAEGR